MKLSDEQSEGKERLTDEQLDFLVKEGESDPEIERCIFMIVRELQLRRKLQEFVRHEITCPKANGGQTCTCGLTSILDELEAL